MTLSNKVIDIDSRSLGSSATYHTNPARPVIVKYPYLLVALFAFQLHCYITDLSYLLSLIGITFIDLSELGSDQYPTIIRDAV
jgi:hypothetical protein